MRLLKITALCFIASVCFSCKKDSDGPQKKEAAKLQAIAAKSIQLFTAYTATKADYLKAKKAFTDPIDTLAFPKINGTLTLPVKNSSQPVVFKDSLSKNDEEALAEYHYLGRVKNPDLYLVEGMFWEWNECYLIDGHTGKKDTLWAMPVFSPDRKMMVSLSPAYGMDGDPNGYQVWQITNKDGHARLKKIREINQEVWIPADVFWENNHTLIFKAITVAVFMKYNGEPKEKDFYYVRVMVSR